MITDMIDIAKKMVKQAYAPYSKFKVGCCIKLKDGRLIGGCNVENISYPVGICAERNALGSMIALGATKEDVSAILIISGDEINPIAPCGMCRQAMIELLPKDCEVYMCAYNGKTVKCKVCELLPDFDSNALKVRFLSDF